MVKPLLFAMKIDLTVNHWFARSGQILVVNKGQMVMLHFISENMYILHINKILVSKKSMFHQIRFLLTLSYTVVGGGGAQSARANFKDSYLRNEYCYSNEIW